MFQEEDPEVDSSRRQIKDVQKWTKDKDFKKKIHKISKHKKNRRCSRIYERRRLQEENPEDDSVKVKGCPTKMKITEDVPVEIDDEDARQMFQNFL